MLQISMAGFEGEPLEDSFVGDLFGRTLPDALCPPPWWIVQEESFALFTMHECTKGV